MLIIWYIYHFNFVVTDYNEIIILDIIIIDKTYNTIEIV